MSDTDRAGPPWVMRTYSGHSSAAASNALYRTNLAKGQTGLSIAFDLPTQTGYDPDAPEAAGEVGKVGVPVAHLGHMRQLLDGHPRRRDEHVDDDQRHRAWLLGLYLALRRGRRASTRVLPGTTQNDIVKEYLVARDLHLPARAPPAADRRHDRLHRAPRAEVEPDQRLQLPPPGGRGDARPGAGLRAGHRHRRARRGARLGQGRRPTRSPPSSGASASSSTPGSASSRRPARCGPSPSMWDEICREPLRRRGPQAAPLPLRRPGRTRSGSPSSSPRTTCRASSSRRSA